MKSKIKYLSVFMLAFAGCALISVGGHKRSPKMPENNSEYANTAVMITALDKRSGGTGVILDSNPSVSHVLTNKHVCGLVQVGGLVITDDGTAYPVDGYQVYKKHDLCLIEVHTDLKVNIKVAEKAPDEYDTSIVSGHPNLLPTMITTGHFSKRQVIQLIVGLSECDGTEEGQDALYCVFVGGKPIIRQFQSQATSSLIMPGSSGSAVFNSKGELSGLIFAGQQGLGYGFLVPWEYVRDFLTHKGRYEVERPNPIKEPKNLFTAYFKFEKYCTDNTSMIILKTCRDTSRLGIWQQ